MTNFPNVIASMISMSDIEKEELIKRTEIVTFNKHDIIRKQGDLVEEVYFVEKGIIRFTTLDKKGKSHTIHFASENQFSTDYTAFLNSSNSIYTVEALEDTKLSKMSKTNVDWLFGKVEEGEKFGRIILDHHYQYLENRVLDKQILTPKERYDKMSIVFPGIHQRVPQYMVASYIGVSKVHLSRLKNE